VRGALLICAYAADSPSDILTGQAWVCFGHGLRAKKVLRPPANEQFEDEQFEDK
jgi:hypothetical protein